MKRLFALFVGVLMLGLAACSSKETETTAEATPPANQNQTYVSQAQSEIDTLQSKLDTVRDSTSWNKFRGNKETRRRLLNDTYAQLGVAKQQLRELQTSTPEEFDQRRAQFEKTLTDVRTAVNTTLAE